MKNLFPFVAVVVLSQFFIGCLSSTFSNRSDELSGVVSNIYSTSQFYNLSGQANNVAIKSSDGHSILSIKKDGRIGHKTKKSLNYQFTFKCIEGSINVERYAKDKLPIIKTFECTGQSEKVVISGATFIELTTRYLNSEAQISDIELINL